MAGISFLDLMFAEALAAGLAREAQRQERPPPDNFFVLPRDPRAWNGVKEACKKENMVVCIEFINEGTASNVFIDLAREFDSIPFLRCKIGPGLGGTFDELRKDLGGVQYTPTILVVFFDDDHTFRVKYEGLQDIQRGLRSGQLKENIKELIERRVKLKLAENLAEQLAQKVNRDMSDREENLRKQYEEKMRREIAEREEKSKKQEEDRKRLEEEEQKKLDQKRKQAAELRKETRPQNVEELMKLDLDNAPIREIKAVMIKMGISPHDCFERSDLKKKLIDNVPELKYELQRKEARDRMPSTGSESSFSSYGYNETSSIFPDSPLDVSELEDLREKNKQLEIELKSLKMKVARVESSQLSSKDQQLASKQKEIDSLTADLQRMTARANKAERQYTELQKVGATGTKGEDKVKELETKLLETRMLYTTTIEDYEILGLIYDSGEEGLILRAKCIKNTLPNKERVYAMKVLTNFFQSQTQTQARQQFQNEYQVLCQLPPHDRIIHMWAFFFDRANPDISPEFKRVGKNARTMSLFLLMDEHPMSLKEQLELLIESQGPKPEKVLEWFLDLLCGLVFLEKHFVVHRDLKLDNLLLDHKGRLVIGDFGKAIILEEDFKMPYVQAGSDIGGNKAHLCPEILNARPGPRRVISYLKQPVWAAGVLAYELAGHPSPFSGGVIDQRGYSVDQLPPLKFTYCKNSKYSQSLPEQFTRLVSSMLHIEPGNRPTLATCFKTISNLLR